MAFGVRNARGFTKSNRAKAKLRHPRAPSQALERSLGIEQPLPKEPMMPKGKIVPQKQAVTKKKVLRPLLGYL